MREIKFRAWIVKDDEYNIIQYMENDTRIFDDPLGEYEKGNIILMQYTGLKDKNGREIYEGDVVKHEFVHPPFGSFVGKVIFKEGSWWIDNHFAAIHLWDESAELVVLGNVFENPELLEESE